MSVNASRLWSEAFVPVFEAEASASLTALRLVLFLAALFAAAT
jgi:hypothetical protein